MSLGHRLLPTLIKLAFHHKNQGIQPILILH